MEESIKNLKIAVLGCLQDYPKARDSDQYLTIMVWMRHFPSRIVELPDGSKAVRLRDVMEMPREDTIKRVRAIIQNDEGKWLPTSLAVAKKRKINEEVWRDYCRNNP